MNREFRTYFFLYCTVYYVKVLRARGFMCYLCYPCWSQSWVLIRCLWQDGVSVLAAKIHEMGKT